MPGDVKWIKIVTDIFDDEKMYAIESLPDGMQIEVVWFKILCLAGKCNQGGSLSISNKIAYTDEMLAKIFRMEIGTVKRALEVFQGLEMVELEDNAYMVSNWSKYQNQDALEAIKKQNRERQRRYRERQRKKESNVTNALESNVTCSISTSYSYSNNSNISNLNYILENNIHTDSSYVLENEDLHQCLEEWMQYKDGRKPKSSNHYGTEIGLKKTITQFVSGYREYGIEALKKVVDDSMANNYSGVVWDKLSRMQKKPKASSEEPKTPNISDRFSCVEFSFRKMLEDAGVIEGQSLNYGPIRDHPEWLQRLKECGVSDL